MNIKKIIEKKQFMKEYTAENSRGFNPPFCFTLKPADIWIVTEQASGKELIHPCSKEWAIKQGWIEENESNAD